MSILKSYISDLKQNPKRNLDKVIEDWKSQININSDILNCDSICDKFPNLLSICDLTKSDLIHYNIYDSYFHDIIECSNKALAIVRSIVRDLKEGQQSYAGVSSYIASRLMAQSLLLLFGIWFSPEEYSEKNYYLMDIFSSKLVINSQAETNVYICDLKRSRIGHSNLWQVFHTIMITTSSPLIIDNATSLFFENLDLKAIPSQRDQIQYHYDGWTFSELDLLKDDNIDIDWMAQCDHNFVINFDDIDSRPNIIFLYNLLNLFYKILTNLQNLNDELDDHIAKVSTHIDILKNWHL